MKKNLKEVNVFFKNKAFTLVELIVVIAILAILWTIAFLSMQWYSSNARDSTRTSDISNVKTSLELFITKTWNYPLPSNYTWVTYSGWLAWNQWTFWNEPYKQLWDINKVIFFLLKYFKIILNRIIFLIFKLNLIY